MGLVEVGFCEGALVGLSVGSGVGFRVGLTVGPVVSFLVGLFVGGIVGSFVTVFVGFSDGRLVVGDIVGERLVGFWVGNLVGSCVVGFSVGGSVVVRAVGTNVGIKVGGGVLQHAVSRKNPCISPSVKSHSQTAQFSLLSTHHSFSSPQFFNMCDCGSR